MLDTEERIEHGGIETQLFSWTDWDGDQECMVFYNPILKTKIGKHERDTKFDSATILWNESKLQFQNFGPEIVEGHVRRREAIYTAEYELKLSVGKVLSE